MLDYIMDIEGKIGQGGAGHAGADRYGVDNGWTTTCCKIAQFTCKIRNLSFEKPGRMFQSSIIWDPITNVKQTTLSIIAYRDVPAIRAHSARQLN